MALGYGRTSTQNFSTAKFIVDTNGLSAGATHSTIAAALTSASSGDTIFIKPGTYTENLTLKAGVNLCSFVGEQEDGQVEIVGKLSASYTGTATVSGIRLTTNSDNCVAISGAVATNLILNNCFINVADNDAIANSSTGAGVLSLNYCRGTTGAALIKYFNFSGSTGSIDMRYCHFQNAGGSATNSTSTMTIRARYCTFNFGIAFTSASGNFYYCRFETLNLSVNCLSSATSGSLVAHHSEFLGDTVANVSIGASTTGNLVQCILITDATNQVDGAGTINFGNLTRRDEDSKLNISTTTQVPFYSDLGAYNASLQPAFSAYLGTSDTNITGDGTNVKLGDTDVATTLTERLDQGGDFTPGASGGATYTAPVTGQHQFNYHILLQGLTADTDVATINITTSNENYTYGDTLGVQSNLQMGFSVFTDMDAADTCQFNFVVSGGAKDCGANGSGAPRTSVSGYLAC